jgi:biopolymer transport protein ExbD
MGLRLIDIRSIRANVERMLAENPEAPVVVNADAESTNGIFVTVLDQARLAGAMKVSLAATD